MALSSAVYVTNEANHNLTPSHKDLLICHFRMVNIAFLHVKWFILQGILSSKEIIKQWKIVKVPSVIPVSLERVVVDTIK